MKINSYSIPIHVCVCIYLLHCIFFNVSPNFLNKKLERVESLKHEITTVGVNILEKNFALKELETSYLNLRLRWPLLGKELLAVSRRSMRYICGEMLSLNSEWKNPLQPFSLLCYNMETGNLILFSCSYNVVSDNENCSYFEQSAGRRRV